MCCINILFVTFFVERKRKSKFNLRPFLKDGKSPEREMIAVQHSKGKTKIGNFYYLITMSKKKEFFTLLARDFLYFKL